MSDTDPKPSDERNGCFLDKMWCCKVCDGEIPDGHTDDCYIWKLEKKHRDFIAIEHDAVLKERDRVHEVARNVIESCDLSCLRASEQISMAEGCPCPVCLLKRLSAPHRCAMTYLKGDKVIYTKRGESRHYDTEWPATYIRRTSSGRHSIKIYGHRSLVKNVRDSNLRPTGAS